MPSEEAVFKDSSNEFTVRVATKPNEIKELLEEGFDFVFQKDNQTFFRERK